MDKLLDSLHYILPSLVSGVIALYFFKQYTKSDVGYQKLQLVKEDKKLSTTLKLQAYERMTLFLERISPANIVFRIKAQNEDKQAYELSLIHTIEQEFEHNLAQQIYITDACWSIISTSKNATVQLIIDASKDTSIKNADALREAIIKKVVNKKAPSDTALSFIKEEVNTII